VKELLARVPERVQKLFVSEEGAVAARARELGITVTVVAKKTLDGMAGSDARHQGLVAEVKPFAYAELTDLGTGLVLFLDGVTDPHNLGAILRSAYLFGADGVVLPKDRSASVNAIASKTSAGASELIPIAQVPNLSRALDAMKERGLWMVALDAGPESKPLSDIDLKGSIGLILGSEGEGVRRGVLSHADFRGRIPMLNQGIGSLNVSVAAGVALAEVARQRQT
jgi:23S rRNA (guanosine2251-2'-O)-methyltransferase